MPEQGEPSRVVEYVSAVIPTPLPDRGVSLARIDGTIIGPRSIARPAFVVSCTCTPCTTPAYGHPGYAHCAACCSASLIEEYDQQCPVADHAEMSRLQFPGDPS